MKRLTFLVFLAILSLTASCETAVDPIVGDPHPFTIWGAFDAGADTQMVRVFSLEDRPGIDRSGGIDASVKSTDLTAGEVRVWNHEEVVYDDGDVGHVFWSAFRAAHGHRYTLEATRSDGAVSSATVTVPRGVEVDLDTRSTVPRILVHVKGDAPHVFAAQMRYEATNVPPQYVLPLGTPIHPEVYFPVAVSYDGKGLKTVDGWQFDINMRADVEEVRWKYDKNCLITAGNPNIALRQVEFRIIAADSAWIPPGGTFDPDVLVEPGTFSNVVNGYGFIGAGEIVRKQWTPVQSLRDELGFRSVQGCDRPDPNNTACTDPPIPCIGENAEDIWEFYFR